MFTADLKKSVHEHFQKKYQYVKTLLERIESASSICCWCETYLAFETSPLDLLLIVSDDNPNLSRKECESEALKAAERKKVVASFEKMQLASELVEILRANARDERLEWLREEIQTRLGFSCDELEIRFERVSSMAIMDLFFQERKRLHEFIFDEWDKMHYRLGQRERAWIECIKQQKEHFFPGCLKHPA